MNLVAPALQAVNKINTAFMSFSPKSAMFKIKNGQPQNLRLSKGLSKTRCI